MSGFDLPPALEERARAGNLSHAYILAGEDPQALERAATGVAAALVCTGSRPPCGLCKGCQKAAKGLHPDILWTRPEPGKDVLVAQARALRREAYVLPNEAPRKVFCVAQAQRMNPSAQNALLKVLEEGPPYAAFLLLTPNPAALLPTIRSRCETVRVPGRTQAGEDRRGQELAGLLLGEDLWALLAWCVPLEKLKREEALGVLADARDALLALRTPKNTPRVAALVRGLGEIIAAGSQNLGVSSIWSWVWSLKGTVNQGEE